MGDRTAVSSLIEEKTLGTNAGAYARMRRRGRAARAPLPAAECPARPIAYEPVQQILQEILRSASGVLGASQAFILVARGSQLEVAGTHGIAPDEVMNAVLQQASLPIHTALREKILTGGDLQGCVLPLMAGPLEHRAPAVLCVPMDLGLRQSGVLCVLRRQQPQKLSDLDLEIVQALTEQAALAIGAASHSSALSRLQASLNTLAPAYA